MTPMSRITLFPLSSPLPEPKLPEKSALSASLLSLAPTSSDYIFGGLLIIKMRQETLSSLLYLLSPIYYASVSRWYSILWLLSCGSESSFDFDILLFPSSFFPPPLISFISFLIINKDDPMSW